MQAGRRHERLFLRFELSWKDDAMLSPFEEAGVSEKQPGRRRIVFLTVAAVSSLLILTLALVLGRSDSTCDVAPSTRLVSRRS